MINRRTFLGTITGGLLAAPRAAGAQQARKPVKDLRDKNVDDWPWGDASSHRDRHIPARHSAVGKGP